MSRTLALLYGLASYAFFLVTFLYAVGFVEGLVVPKTIDSGPVAPFGEALLVNLALLAVFAVQHSLMARPAFKAWWTQFVPKSIERSTYVLFATASLALICWQWQPMPTVLWRAGSPLVADIMIGLSMFGWLVVLTSTYLINHFELFGLQQVMHNMTGREAAPAIFRTPFFYKFVRHPIYLGFIIAFWATPSMTVGHLLFAAGTTGYIVIGILLEEHDLVALFGDDYRRYRARVGMLFPWRKAA
ncbi:MAG: isoprenylcysteine carboxylmethyltransferase family protein [Proteobacteria bacterium]|nr:isoprenylcysteine carboxylmethyltransferase family protein [Pseudomonadota bacterium]